MNAPDAGAYQPAPDAAPQWTPERTTAPDDARALIAAQFPEFANARVEPFGNGWDNTAFLVDGAFVFRFPRREIAVPLIARELAILPLIAGALPAPIPVPRFAGVPSASFPWPFAGYPRLAGTTVDAAPGALGGTRLARDLGAFVGALHAIDPSGAIVRDLPPDELGRLDHARCFPKARDRLAALHAVGAIADPQPLVDELLAIAPRANEAGARIVHGDLYARHVLVAEDGRLAGVIDWGDVHAGDPALDLSVAELIFTAGDREAFFAAYGDVEARTRERARYRAIYHAALVADYGVRIGDGGLALAGTSALKRIAPPSVTSRRGSP